MKSKRLSKKLVLNIAILIAIVYSVITSGITSDAFHTGGIYAVKQIASAMLTPNLSSEVLKTGLIATLKTIVYGFAGMTLATILGFIMSLIASGILFDGYRINKLAKMISLNLLGLMRSVHELVWALLFVTAFGLSPLSGVLAIGIPYGGMLGKIWTSIFEDMPSSIVSSLKANGATNLQILIYGYLPYSFDNMFSYGMYRLECALRSSAVMSFVGLGGLGYQIQLTLNDLLYSEMWTYIYFLMIMVVFFDLLSNKFRSSKREKNYSIKRNILLSIIAAISIYSWYYIFNVDHASFSKLFSEKNMSFAVKFFKSLFGYGSDIDSIAFFNPEQIGSALVLTVDTIKMSILAIMISVIMMLITVLPGSIIIADGTATGEKSFLLKVLYFIVRGTYIFSRAIPELIWAMIIVFLFKPGIIPGAIALGLHNYGILGKLCAEVVEDMDIKPLKSLASSGAGNLQIMVYGILPSVFKKFITYIIYRWEIILRTTIVVGLVGAGGLGYMFRLSLSYFHYTEVTLVLICYLLLVKLSDFLSNNLRRAYGN